ncbi:UNVERIFIED_CONTAM: hypothetical protein Cloal_0936 [Acetivibrio alkalicellulosi]
MVCDETKRIVIIKNIPSNVVEEAILVLKDRPAKGEKNVTTIFPKSSDKRNEYIVKEAEDIIKKYVKGKSNLKDLSLELKLRPYTSKFGIFANTLASIILLGSIAALIFMITKIFWIN